MPAIRTRLESLTTDLPRAYWLLWLGTVINRLGGFVIPFLSLYLTSERGITVPQAGLIVSLFGAGSFAAHLAGGELADRLGRRPVLLLSLLGTPENALKYVPRGGQIDVGVAADERMVTLTVADSGPGIPAAERVRILQPFVRLERDREKVGSGLGLSLVAAVMRLHRGTVELLDNGPGPVVRCRMQPE